VKSYNTLNNTNKTPLKNFGTSRGWSLNADVWLNENVFMGYYQHKITANASSTINDYYSREFDLTQKAWGADFGGGAKKDKYGVAAFFGIYFAVATITSGIKYRDGYMSIGNEATLNGIYHGFGFSGSVGVKGYQFFGPIGITACARWCPMSGTSEVSDFGKASAASSATNLPEDWGAYVGGGSVSYNYKGAYVKPNFQSYFLELGLALNLSSN